MSDNATLVERLSSTTHVGFELDDLCEEAGTRIAELEAEVARLTERDAAWFNFALEVIRAGETLDPRRAADAALEETP